MPAATSRRPVKYRNHWPRPILANSSTITAAPANLAPPTPIKSRAAKPERIQRVVSWPLSEAAGSALVVIIRLPPVGAAYIDINIIDVNNGTRQDAEGMQRKQDTSGVHGWLVLAKAFRALTA